MEFVTKIYPHIMVSVNDDEPVFTTTVVTSVTANFEHTPHKDDKNKIIIIFLIALKLHNWQSAEVYQDHVE